MSCLALQNKLMWLILDASIPGLEEKFCSLEILAGLSVVSRAVTSSCCGLECASYFYRRLEFCRMQGCLGKQGVVDVWKWWPEHLPRLRAANRSAVSCAQSVAGGSTGCSTWPCLTPGASGSFKAEIFFICTFLSAYEKAGWIMTSCIPLASFWWRKVVKVTW